MKLAKCFVVVAVLVAVGATFASAQMGGSEDDIVAKYLTKADIKHKQTLGWASLHFSGTQINKNNNYNDFANYVSGQIDGGQIDWLSQGFSIGAEFGVIFKEKIAWSLGGDFWLTQGNSLSGTFAYSPGGGSTSITDPASKVKVLGAYTGFHYYLFNPPNKSGQLDGFSFNFGGSIGYYLASWDLWSTYQNLNLATAATSWEENVTFKGSAPGFSFDIGADYPLKIWNMAIGAEVGYLYLNFTNIAWYNASDDEVVVTYQDTEDSRVDLALSGVRGKFALKRFFSW
ncbi:MAG: hypothetical protein V3T31_12330 [candidate division Zixibacteria bacterium]